eukprot:m.36367 g.36367  ORF g.36367 m.36367 type:complete len:677 (+) comp32247_c0_seq1:117-2147(+)
MLARLSFARCGQRGVARLIAIASFWAVFSCRTATAACPDNSVKNPSADNVMPSDWNLQQPDSSQSGTAFINNHFQITTTGLESIGGAKGYFSQTFYILSGASMVTIRCNSHPRQFYLISLIASSAEMKRDKPTREGSPYVQAETFASDGTTKLGTLASTDLQPSGTSLSWATYSHSFVLPSNVVKMAIYLKAAGRPTSQAASGNVAYFDDICVQFAKLTSSIDPPSPIAVNSSSPFKMTCSVGGIDQATFTWLKDGVQVPGVTPTYYILNAQVSSRLIFLTTAKSDEGLYKCNANTTRGVVSAQAVLVVDVPPVFLKIEIPKIAKPGQDLSLPCAASGKPNPTVTWYKNDVEIGPSDAVYLVDSISLSLTIKSLNPSRDSGVYKCIVRNRAGTIYKPYNLTIQGVRPVPVSGAPTTETVTEAISRAATVKTIVTKTKPVSTASTFAASSAPTPIWEKKFGGLALYIWIAIGAGVLTVIVIVVIACCCVSHNNKRSKKRERERHQMSVHYKASKRNASYAVGDKIRMTGPAYDPRPYSGYSQAGFYPEGYYPTYPESGYNSNVGTMDRNYTPSPGHYPVGPRHSLTKFPSDHGRLIPPRHSQGSLPPLPTSGHSNDAFYEELPPVKEEKYVTTHAPGTIEEDTASLEESNLDVSKRGGKQEGRTQIPDTPGDIDYKI